MSQEKYEIVIQYLTENQQLFYRLAYSYARNRDDALDIVQNAVCKALEHYRSLRSTAGIRTWFYRILVNESLALLKRQKREVSLDLADAEPAYSETAFEPSENWYEKIQCLPIPQQTVIKLRFFEEMSLNEIADITGVNINTVKTRLYDGLKKLRIEIEEVS